MEMGHTVKTLALLTNVVTYKKLLSETIQSVIVA